VRVGPLSRNGGLRRRGGDPATSKSACAESLAVARAGRARSLPAAWRGFCPTTAGGPLARGAGAPDAAASSPRPHSVYYLRTHCPIVVQVNIYTAGYKSASRNGVSVHGRLLPSGEVAKYYWTLDKHVSFCGTVGAWYGTRYVSLRPTSQTGTSGDYTDPSPRDNATPSGSFQGFYVYARRAW
jgi:hypothetical protein